MNRFLVFFAILHATATYGQQNQRMIARQGKLSFFSYTSVENIEATNNQVLSIIDKKEGTIGVSMLMRAFVFKKSLMEEHFNESYVESDIYPKTNFSGKIVDFDSESLNNGVAFIKGNMEMHGATKEIEVKVKIENEGNKLVMTGDFEVPVADFDIKVPPLLTPNIAKIIQVMFRFEYEPYEE
ncbi:YceI family protein [Flagellimonas onchidii]|uniref:YceI family protein n=1 Tax=Flagellimonas onchidii TaxID=2562684 RepID=UPI001F10646F|nr:YceI family protein [Allomuricauda onchidii]